jgi:transketolase
MQKRMLPETWDKDLPSFPADAKGVAGRDASAKVLNQMAKNVPWLMGGPADLVATGAPRGTAAGVAPRRRRRVSPDRADTR